MEDFNWKDLKKEETKEKIVEVKKEVKKKVVVKRPVIEKKQPKFRKEVKYFLTYIGPPCKLRIAGIPEQRIKRNKEYEVAQKVYEAFLNVEGYRVEKKTIKVEI